MSKLPKIGDVEHESSYGYVFAVSGPGKFTNFEIILLMGFFFFSCYGRKDERFCYVRTGEGWLFGTCRRDYSFGRRYGYNSGLKPIC